MEEFVVFTEKDFMEAMKKVHAQQKHLPSSDYKEIVNCLMAHKLVSRKVRTEVKKVKKLKSRHKTVKECKFTIEGFFPS